MSKRQSVLYFSYSTLFSRVKGHKGSPVLPRLLPSIVMGSLLRRAHFESLRAAEAKNSATINQLKYRSRSCITANIALGYAATYNNSPNVKAPKCTLFFIQYFIFQGQRSQGITGLATAPSEHRDGQLTSESPFRIVESG